MPEIIYRDKSTAGITLVEILVAVALLAILATIAIPQITKYYRTYKYNQYVSEVETTIKWARLVAMERGISVSIILEGAGTELKIYNSGTNSTPQTSGTPIRIVRIAPSDQTFVKFEGSGFPVGFDARGLVIGQDSAILKVRRTDTNTCVQFEFKRMSGYIIKGQC